MKIADELDCEYCGKVFIPKGEVPWEPEKIIALALHVAEEHDTWGSEEQEIRTNSRQSIHAKIKQQKNSKHKQHRKGRSIYPCQMHNM